MNSLLAKIVERKKLEIAAAKASHSIADLIRIAENQTPPLDFVSKLCRPQKIGLIAEVKKASPSKGVIRADFNPVEIAKIYQRHGADCISVLTDEPFFQGHLDYLKAIRQEVEIPLLRKDFILDEYQVVEARAAGADAVLLIAECLTPEQLIQLHQKIIDWGMTPLVELYDPANIGAVLQCQPKLVGVNNRDLNTFEVDLEHSIRIRRQLPDDTPVVSESGIETAVDVQRLLKSGIAAILVGESLMKVPDIGAAVDRMMSSVRG